MLQGAEAGGHRASFTDTDEEPLSTLVLLRLVARRIRLPLIASGGLTDGPAVAAALAAGAAAAQLGTAFLLADEAGTESAYRDALLSRSPTALTRAFSGRRARGIVNQFMTRALRGGAVRLSAYPPCDLPNASRGSQAGRRRRIQPLGGQAHLLAPSGPAAEILRAISEGARQALEAAANRPSRIRASADAAAQRSAILAVKAQLRR